jgi:alkylhydroperoxidase family enzyme
VLRAKFLSAEQVPAIVRDFRNAGLSPAEVALMNLADKVVRNANQVTRDDLEALRGHGFLDQEILDIILTAASRTFFSKVTDAVGFEPDEAWLKQTEKLLGADSFRTLMVGRSYTAAQTAR